VDIQRPFDRAAVRRQRERAAGANFLLREAVVRLVDRLDDVRRTFSDVLALGDRNGELARALDTRPGIRRVVRADFSRLFAHDAAPAVALDEEWLPFVPGSFDLVLSALDLHWVNDLPGALVQINHALRPDGLFLAVLPGGETLTELRQALLEAESEIAGGAGLRVSPFVDVREAAGLLQRAGFALPVADVETLNVSYASAIDLMRDLRALGEGNALMERRRGFTRRAVLLRAAAIYGERFGDVDGRVRATFQLVTMTGWAPHADQPKPLPPGSAERRLAEALGVTEQSAGDRAAPRPRPT
jgi:SAM-dependent methyltransferase